MLATAGLLVLAVAGVFLIVEGDILIMDSNAQVAASGGGQPCHGHTVCLQPGIEQPEGQLGLHYIYLGLGLIAVSLVGVILVVRKARRLYSSQRVG